MVRPQLPRFSNQASAQDNPRENGVTLLAVRSGFGTIEYLSDYCCVEAWSCDNTFLDLTNNNK